MSQEKNIDVDLGKILEIVDDPDGALFTGDLEPEPTPEPTPEPKDDDDDSSGKKLDVDFDEPIEPDESKEPEEPVEPEEPTEPTESDEPEGTETAYFEFLKEQGILDVPDDFEFDGSTESLIEALEITKENLGRRGFQKVMSSLPQSTQEALLYAINGGDLSKYYSTAKDLDLDSYDLESAKDQREVIRLYYELTTEHSPEKIERLVNRIAVDENDLKEEAIDALNYLKDFDRKRKEDLIQEQRYRMEAARQETQKFIETTVNTIDSLELPNNRKAKLKNFMFQPVETGDGVVTTSFAESLSLIKKNPKHLAELANIVMGYNPEKGFNLEGVELKQRSKIIDDFRKKLDKVPLPGKKTTSKKNNKGIDWNTILTHL